MNKTTSLLALIVLIISTSLCQAATHKTAPFIEKMEQFPAQEKAQGITGIGEKLSFRAMEEPFLLVSSIIFILAIIHTFFAVPINKYAHKLQHQHDSRIRKGNAKIGKSTKSGDMVCFKATMFHFLGEIEAIFGIWVLALMGAIVAFYDLSAVESYISSVNFTEPMFVVIIMAFASTRPVLKFAEVCLQSIAKLGKETPGAWWLTIMIVAPILGSFITEPGAMTIGAMLLAKKLYRLKPSSKFAYATLGLLFVNISIGGVLTNFAAPPVLMVAQKWNISSMDMLLHFGDKAVIAIVISTLLYYFCFRKELARLATKLEDHDGDGTGDLIEEKRPIPFWIMATHLLFMAWTVYFAHTPALFIGGFLFFLAFRQATAHHQSRVELKGPILVGFFLAGLVIHGGLQGWWLAPIITSLSEWPLFIGSIGLTAFNDNAAITFLASQVEGLTPAVKYAVLAGAVSGGGLTVIANAPNPAGQAILSRFFGEGISPAKLLLAALIPTIIAAILMMGFPDPSRDSMFEESPAPSQQAPKTK